MRCLIAQSDPTLCAMICDTLEALGHSATCAETPSEALRRLGRTRYELLILDHALPAREAGRLTHAAIETPGDTSIITLSGSEVFPEPGGVRFAPAIMRFLSEDPRDRMDDPRQHDNRMNPELAWLS